MTANQKPSESEADYLVKLRDADILTCECFRSRMGVGVVYFFAGLFAYVLYLPIFARESSSAESFLAYLLVGALFILLAILAMTALDRQLCLFKISNSGIEVSIRFRFFRLAWQPSTRTEFYRWRNIVSWYLADELPNHRSMPGTSQGVAMIISIVDDEKVQSFKIGGYSACLNKRRISPARFVALVYPYLPDSQSLIFEHSQAAKAETRTQEIIVTACLAALFFIVAFVFELMQVNYWLVFCLPALFFGQRMYFAIRKMNNGLDRAAKEWVSQSQHRQAIEQLKYTNAPLRKVDVTILETMYRELRLKLSESRAAAVFVQVFQDLLAYKSRQSEKVLDAPALKQYLQKRVPR